MSDVLQARTMRSKMIDEWNKRFKHASILVLKLNVVGANKNIHKMQFILRFFNHQLCTQLGDAVEHSEYITSLDGDYFIYAIHQQSHELKQLAIELEESCSIGRLIDIDVYSEEAVSRTDLSKQMRKCLICDDVAHHCGRSKRHTKTALFEKMDEIIQSFLIDYLSEIAIHAMEQELQLYPKFGLVSLVDAGCHKDMNDETFRNSIKAIKPFVREYIQAGITKEEPFVLQEIGKRAEMAMFEATNQINTHKGLIFLLGIFLDALVNTLLLNQGKDFLQSEIKQKAKAIVGDYHQHVNKKEHRTHGDELYLKYGLKGVRGEALKGLPLIFLVPPFKQREDKTHLHEYLISLMAELDDTTIVHKCNYQTLIEVQKDMKSIVKSGGYTLHKETVNRLSDEYKARNISPGGSADLLVIKLIYEETKILFAN